MSHKVTRRAAPPGSRPPECDVRTRCGVAQRAEALVGDVVADVGQQRDVARLAVVSEQAGVIIWPMLRPHYSDVALETLPR